jgi:hypothetical protein
MHLVEAYATNCGLKIDRPYMYEKFFPLNVEKYITLHPFTKPAKSYDYWQEVVNLLLPVLEKENIRLIQIGAKDEPKIVGAGYTAGQTNMNQIAYLIKGGLLHLGVDSFPTHVASAYDKKIVCLYSSNHLACTKPYWGDSENHVLFMPDLKGNKPSFSTEESPKTINTIKPEKIASSVCSLLGIDFDFPYETIYLGPTFGRRLIESIPNSVVDVSSLGVDSLIVRMDYDYNEENLVSQMQVCPVSIITDKPISKKILTQFRSRIKEVIYIIEKVNHPQFVLDIQELNIRHIMLSTLKGKDLSDAKINYMDCNAIINEKPIKKQSDIEELSGRDIKKLFYKSNKFTLSEGKVFLSWADLKAGNPTEGFTAIHPVTDSDDFWVDLEYFSILEKVG